MADRTRRRFEADRRALTEMVKATMESWRGRKISPVYQLMPNLQEPDWKSLRIGDVLEFWSRHDDWKDRVEGACRAGSIGDALVLADEAPVAAFRADAWITAGVALRKAKRFKFALEQLERGLDVDPLNLTGLREQGTCLQRFAIMQAPGHSLDRARTHYDHILKTAPFANDPETWALLGRVDKDAWVAPGACPARRPRRCARRQPTKMRCCAPRSRATPTATGAIQGHYYSGINALTLMHLYRHLTDDARYDAEARRWPAQSASRRLRRTGFLLFQGDDRRPRDTRRDAGYGEERV
jgi:tetratricopeptide (TPR) repeat protein